MLMRYYLGHAVGHTYTHDSQPMLSVNDSMVIPDCEDIDINLTHSHPDSEDSSGSDLDFDSMSTESDSTSAKSDAMDVDHEEDD